MTLKGKRIGFGLTGSHCTYDEVYPEIQRLLDEGAEVRPIISNTLKTTDTRFGKSADWIQKLEDMTGFKVVDSIVAAEPLGPKIPLDCMVIAPLTGNSLSKLANALTDGPVLMAAKATMRNNRPVVIGLSTNDALGLNATNIGRLLGTRNIYFVPFGQDNPWGKPNSMVAKMDLIYDTVMAALNREQYQPLIIEAFRRT